jgi:glucosamine-6-phosphate deaminase
VSFDVEVHPADRWADAVASELVERLRAEPSLRIVLPTGDTPGPLYEALVRRSEPGLWALATAIILDDYVGLAPDDPASGGPRLRRELIDHVRPAAFVEIDAAAPDQQAAADAHDAVAAAGMDLALVGLGLNGHIGFNEPGSDASSATRVVELHPRSREVAEGYGTDDAPEHGITLGLARLLEANEIWLLVTGERKAEILRATIEGPETPAVPASFLRRHPRCRVLADEHATALLAR